jgi:hypothetical protein
LILEYQRPAVFPIKNWVGKNLEKNPKENIIEKKDIEVRYMGPYRF